ncbi:haloacid dehalogenase [Punctularia strigosozonata HHB-11173 SS5]|uniref:haloacid dehalogenase n=1 Tax=Punctularia strigosozonata (strain HHB-11173) TaxID=741275 RepID=UPI0004418579|nr:haloacid dehalogenase [Punctularia strigosozonata HHB-11173 SS5]EIN09587.1 haloacid dehalogenase [Punctularia strigosozonata HHB-11173 SS5]
MATELRDVEAFVFDVLGTVVNVHGTLVREIRGLAQTHGHNTDEDWAAFASEWTVEYDNKTKNIAKGDCGPSNLDVLNQQILAGMLSSPRWKHLEDLFEERERRELGALWHRLDGWGDSSPGLYSLKRHYLIATLSNGNVRLLADIAKQADLPWDIIFSGEPLGSYKPNPKVYLGAAHHLGLPPNKVAMVASHVEDLRAAATHGMKTVYLRRHTEDIDIVKLDDGTEVTLRDTVKAKKDGGDIDIVVNSIPELARIAYAF